MGTHQQSMRLSNAPTSARSNQICTQLSKRRTKTIVAQELWRVLRTNILYVLVCRARHNCWATMLKPEEMGFDTLLTECEHCA